MKFETFFALACIGLASNPEVFKEFYIKAKEENQDPEDCFIKGVKDLTWELFFELRDRQYLNFEGTACF